MAATIRAELLKLLTIRTTAGLLVATTLIAGLLAGGASSVAGTGGNPPIGDPQFIANLLGGPQLALVVAVVGGVLLASGEYHHGTAVPTFLVTPRRGRVIAAKAVAAVALGLVLAAAALAATLLVGSLVASGESVSVLGSLEAAHVRMIATTALLGAFYAVAGVAVGTLVRNQVGALAVAVVWSQLVETALVPTFAPAVAPWLPNGLFASLAGAVRPDLVSVWVAVALVPLYAVALVAVAARTVETADLS